MAEQLYYIKSKRKTAGPFPLSQLEKMYRSNLLSASDMISDNKVSWQSAEQFFAPPETAEKSAKKELSVIKTVSLNVQKVFFPKLKVPAAEAPVEKTPVKKAPAVENKKSTIVVPDPVCSVISMIWNAPAALKNLQLMREFKYRSKAEDNTSHYAVISAGALIFLLFMLQFAATALYIPHRLGTVLLTALLAVAIFIVFLLENLCLLAILNIKKLLDTDLLMMQMLLTCVGAFCFALPLAGAECAGMENIPPFLKVLIIFFSSASVLGTMINMVFGFCEINRRIFKMTTGALASVCVLQVFQLLVTGIVSWKLFKFI